MGQYDDLGIRRVINTGASQTVLGGSLMPEPVLTAMHDAAKSFVFLPELHDLVGEKIAALTKNEAACVCCGAAAGILVTAAACVAGADPERVHKLPDIAGVAKNEIVIFKNHMNGFMTGVLEVGATIVEIDGTVDALNEALSDRTACVMWFDGPMWGEGALPLDETIALAHALAVPVVVDAADQIPPLSNLWRYTVEQGADLAIFSGGKGLRGPQSSGIIVGKADLIRACRANSGPYHSIGRPAKVGKEEMVGVLAALEYALATGEEQDHADWSAAVDLWLNGLAGIPGTTLSRATHSHSGQPIPRAVIHLAAGTEARDAAIKTLWERDPRIAVLPEGDGALALNPHHLQPGEAELVLTAVREVLSA
jgi:L-seryl-tRNA(Ser) seleniumtransferase